MNKGELIAAISEKTDLGKNVVEKALNGFLDVVGETLAKGEDITLIGFGSFKTMQRAAKKGRNPRTGEEITIPASRVIKFTPGKILKEKVK